MSRTLFTFSAIVAMMVGLCVTRPQAYAQTDNDEHVLGEQNPEYPGGEEALYEFIAKNLKYPKAAKDSNITGRVFVLFIVEKDGSISNVRIFRDIGGGCGEAAAEVVKKMPKWKPGKAAGKPIRVQFNLPINFQLSEEEK